MRFLVDENIPLAIGRFLEQLGHDVINVRHSELVGATDEVLWVLAAEQQRVIVTHDRDYPVLGISDLPAGLILIRPRDNRPAAIEALFRDFWSKVGEADILGQIISVQPGRSRRRRLK